MSSRRRDSRFLACESSCRCIAVTNGALVTAGAAYSAASFFSAAANSSDTGLDASAAERTGADAGPAVGGVWAGAAGLGVRAGDGRAAGWVRSGRGVSFEGATVGAGRDGRSAFGVRETPGSARNLAHGCFLSGVSLKAAYQHAQRPTLFKQKTARETTA